jgi:hypothetical protein
MKVNESKEIKIIYLSFTRMRLELFLVQVAILTMAVVSIFE